MTTGTPGAVFFLGSRAHYQVLQQPDPQFDAENGNTEIFQNSLTAEYNGGYSVLDDVNVPEDNDKDSLKRRNKRRPSETTDEMKPAQLNNVANGNDNAPKEKSSRRSLLAFLSSLSRRKKRLNDLQYLQHIESVLTTCTYRECCRCLECQSSYFDCDLDEEYVDSEDDDSEYNKYVQQLQMQVQRQEESDDDEVFVEQVASDSTSTDILLETKKMSVSSDSSEDPETMNLEVAAGTPLLLNFLLTHPITCSIQ